MLQNDLYCPFDHGSVTFVSLTYYTIWSQITFNICPLEWYEYNKPKYTLMAEFSTYLYAAVDLAKNFFTVFLETTQGLEPHLIRFWDFVWYTFVKLQRNSFLLIVYAYSKPFVVADYKKSIFLDERICYWFFAWR